MSMLVGLKSSGDDAQRVTSRPSGTTKYSMSTFLGLAVIGHVGLSVFLLLSCAEMGMIAELMMELAMSAFLVMVEARSLVKARFLGMMLVSVCLC